MGRHPCWFRRQFAFYWLNTLLSCCCEVWHGFQASIGGSCRLGSKERLRYLYQRAWPAGSLVIWNFASAISLYEIRREINASPIHFRSRKKYWNCAQHARTKPKLEHGYQIYLRAASRGTILSKLDLWSFRLHLFGSLPASNWLIHNSNRGNNNSNFERLSRRVRTLR